MTRFEQVRLNAKLQPNGQAQPPPEGRSAAAGVSQPFCAEETHAFPYLELRIWKSISPFAVSPYPASIFEQYPSFPHALSR